MDLSSSLPRAHARGYTLSPLSGLSCRAGSSSFEGTHRPHHGGLDAGTTVDLPFMALPDPPKVYILAGPNGSGKSTFARLFLPDYADCKEFVNADLIAAGLSPFNPEGLAIQAGRLMLKRIETLAAAGVDFGFETTLAGRSYTALLRSLRERGYRIHLFFLWLPSVETALARVEERVQSGGHSIPEEVVRRRFSRGLANLFHLYDPFLNDWMILENIDAPRMVAVSFDGTRFVADPATFDRILEEAGSRDEETGRD